MLHITRGHIPARARWMPAAAAVVAVLLSGGVLTTSASVDSGERSAFVPIAPCRLLDTRPGSDNVGTRSTPVGPGEVLVADVRGANGNCTIPTDAIGVVMNVAIVQPSNDSFLTVYPADAPRPLAANLNWVAGQAPEPNAVTARLSADGDLAFYNLSGTVHLAVDVNGYYVDHTHDDRYYTETQLERGPTAIGILERMSDTDLALGRWWADPGRNMGIELGGEPGGLAFDGTRVWASLPNQSALKAVDVRTGEVVTTIVDARLATAGRMAFDGRYLWVGNTSGDLVQVDPLTGTIVGVAAVGGQSWDVVFDGTNLWVAGSGALRRVAPGTRAVTFVTNIAPSVSVIEFDGRYVWVANFSERWLSKVDVTTLAVSHPASSLSGEPTGLAFDGQYLWVAEDTSHRVIAIDPSNNTYVSGSAIVIPSTPGRLSYDGTSLWVQRGAGLYRIDRSAGVVATTASTTITPTIESVFDGFGVWSASSTGIARFTAP